MSATTEATFMELVQQHERTWGMEQYPGRPSLAALLESPVVVMWDSEPRSTTPPGRRAPEPRIPSGRYVFTLYAHVDALNAVVYSMVISGKSPIAAYRRLGRIFVNQKPMHIKGLRLMLSE
jgi:hypothetical protein